jgi:hypothetical protein
VDIVGKSGGFGDLKLHSSKASGQEMGKDDVLVRKCGHRHCASVCDSEAKDDERLRAILEISVPVNNS